MPPDRVEMTEITMPTEGRFLRGIFTHLYLTFSSDGQTDKTEDTLADSAIDQFASKEGLPAGLDPEMNNLVNDEINKL
jgi:hypothetical protein